MTRQQEEAAVRENPLQFSVRPELFCGARALRMQRSRSSCRMPQALAEELGEAHASEPELLPGLNPESAWKITRCLFAWPDGKPSAASRPSWTLRLSADTVTVPAGPVLSAAAGCRPFSLDVPHPVSGQRYRIQVLQVRGERMDFRRNPCRIFCGAPGFHPASPCWTAGSRRGFQKVSPLRSAVCGMRMRRNGRSGPDFRRCFHRRHRRRGRTDFRIYRGEVCRRKGAGFGRNRFFCGGALVSA